MTGPYEMTGSAERDSIFPHDFLYYVQVLARQKMLFTFAFGLTFLLGVAWVVLTPKVYASDAKLLLTAGTGSAGAGTTTKPEERLEVARQKALSRRNLLWLAEKYGLADSGADEPSDAVVTKMRQRIYLTIDNSATRGVSGPVVVTVTCEGPSPEAARDLGEDVVAMLVIEDGRAQASNATATRLRAVRSELTEKQQIYSESHPIIRALRDQVTALEALLKAEAISDASSSKAPAQPKASGPLLGSEADRIEVIDKPAVRQNPVRPNRAKLLLIVAAAALACGAGAAFLRERVWRSIRPKASADLFQAGQGKAMGRDWS